MERVPVFALVTAGWWCQIGHLEGARPVVLDPRYPERKRWLDGRFVEDPSWRQSSMLAEQSIKRIARHIQFLRRPFADNLERNEDDLAFGQISTTARMDPLLNEPRRSAERRNR